MSAASVYIHIPFCRSKCAYCDFYSLPGQAPGLMNRYAQAVALEARLRNSEADAARSVFFGGGTPSLMPVDALSSAFAAVTGVFPLCDNAEVTLEANPATFDERQARAWRSMGFNRVSVGIQTLDDGLLRVLGRAHTSAEALSALRALRTAGFSNLSADLMYGLPGQTLKQWRATLMRAMDEGLPHLSCYALTLEEGTPLCARVERGLLTLPDDDAICAMMDDACTLARKAGYERYEISNFAQPGFRCAHNLAYWTRAEYIGLGAAAHGFTGSERYANASDIYAYMTAIEGGVLPEIARNNMTYDDERTETVMLRLRLSDGIARDAYPLHRVDSLIAHGLLRENDGVIAVTDKGMYVHNAVLRALLHDS